MAADSSSTSVALPARGRTLNAVAAATPLPQAEGRWLPWAALTTTLLLWASAFVGIRAALRSYAPGHLALLRFLIASTAMAFYALRTRMRWPDVRDLPAIVTSGFFGITLYHAALCYGERTVTAGSASLLGNTVPIFTALLVWAFLRERLPLRGWLGIAASFAGAVLIVRGEADGWRWNVGALFVLVSNLSQAIYFVLQKPLLRKYKALEFAAYAIWSGAFLLLPFLPGLAGEVLRAPLGATLAVVYLGIFPGAIAYTTWAYFLSRAAAAKASTFLYLIPMLTVLIGWAWLGELPAFLSLVGGAIALAGVLIVNSRSAGAPRLLRRKIRIAA